MPDTQDLIDDTRFMREALAEAAAAEAAGEVPVGCIIVLDGQIIARGSNRPIARHDATAHAEMEAIRAAGQALGNYRLTGSTLYVTLEPCPMCAGAMVHARVGRLVYGAPDQRAGAAGTVFNLLRTTDLNHRVEVSGGVLGEECREQLLRFFRSRR